MDSIMLRCPNCGANLNVRMIGSREYVFCEYCGTKIRLEDKNTTTYRYIDEARIREAELYTHLRERELEPQNLKNEEYEKKVAFNRNFFRKRIFIYLIVAAVCGALGYSIKNSNISEFFLWPAVIALIALTYGSAGHAIALLVKRKRYK